MARSVENNATCSFVFVGPFSPFRHVSRLQGQFFPNAFAENQIEEIERRDKLQRLRGQGKIDASPPMQRQSTKKSSTSLTPDLLKDHLDHEKTKKVGDETSRERTRPSA